MTQNTDNLTGAHTQRELGADALLPCPFCGGVPKYDPSSDCSAQPYVYCQDCASHVVGQTEAEAHAAWKRRAPVTQFVAQDGDLVSRAAVLRIFQPETSMVRKRICDDVRALPSVSSAAQAEAQEPVALADADHTSLYELLYPFVGDDGSTRCLIMELSRRYAHPATPAPVEAGLIEELEGAARWRRLPGNENHHATAAILERAVAALRNNRRAIDAGARNNRDTFDAMCAMRDAINEYIPMPSLESDLLQGPENGVFCATVAEAVIAALRAQSAPVAGPSQAALDVLAERQRQISAEGWTSAHDDDHGDGQMAGAAACYALTGVKHWAAVQAPGILWPWEKSWWKPTDNRRDLVKAGALILAEIERIDRAASVAGEGGEG